MSEAATVAEALGQLPQSWDWILLDLMLPDGSGLNVLRRAQAQNIPSRICIITGCDSCVLQEAADCGADCIFTKPLDVTRLIALLTNHH